GTLLIALLMAATSCSRQASRVEPRSDGPLPAMHTLDLPSPALLDDLLPREVSDNPLFASTLDADAFIASSSAVVADENANTAEIPGTAGALEWAIYRFGPLEQSLGIGGVQALYNSA